MAIGWFDRRVLVTGGAGFIGSHLVEKLAACGARVTVVDSLSTGHLENLAVVDPAVELRQVDVRDVDWEADINVQKYEVIFHLAANAYVPPSVERPSWDCEINFGATFRLLEALRCCAWRGALVYASSAAVYGHGVHMPIREEDPLAPISPYGVSKLASERYLAVYSQLYGLRGASARIFSCYGPRQRKQVIFDLLTKLRQNPNELFIYGDGTQTRDFNYVGDTARGLMLIAQAGALAGETYNLASGRACSIGELAQVLAQILRLQPRFVYSGSVRPGDPERWLADISHLASLGYHPQVSLEEGLQNTVDWFLSANNRL